MAKSDLVAKAVELELGTREDLEALTVKDLEELLKESDPPTPPESDGDDEDEIVPEATKEAPPKRKAGVTTVADLQRLGRVKVAK